MQRRRVECKKYIKSCTSLNELCEKLNIDIYKKVKKSKDELIWDIMHGGMFSDFSGVFETDEMKKKKEKKEKKIIEEISNYDIDKIKDVTSDIFQNSNAI